MKVHVSTPAQPARYTLLPLVDFGTEVNDVIALFLYAALVLISFKHLVQTISHIYKIADIL